jgi:hypothetical protein
MHVSLRGSPLYGGATEGLDTPALGVDCGAAWGVCWASVEVRATDRLSASAVSAAEATVALAV